jgi:hypothetical protein
MDVSEGFAEVRELLNPGSAEHNVLDLESIPMVCEKAYTILESLVRPMQRLSPQSERQENEEVVTFLQRAVAELVGSAPGALLKT